jgi:hypothetical protein
VVGRHAVSIACVECAARYGKKRNAGGFKRIITCHAVFVCSRYTRFETRVLRFKNTQHIERFDAIRRGTA